MSVDIESEIEIITENLQCQTDKKTVLTQHNLPADSVPTKHNLPVDSVCQPNLSQDESIVAGSTQTQLNTLNIDTILNMLSHSELFNQPVENRAESDINDRERVSQTCNKIVEKCLRQINLMPGNKKHPRNSANVRRLDKTKNNQIKVKSEPEIKHIEISSTDLNSSTPPPEKCKNISCGTVCQLCSTKFSTRDELNDHMGKEHLSGEGKFLCPVCNHGCWQLGNLKRHMRIHEKHLNNKPYKCEVCGHETTCKSYMKKHMRRHTGEKPYHCQFCDYKSATWICLKRHETRHTGIKPFRCSVCGYGAVQRQGLNIHMRKHEKVSNSSSSADNL